MENSKTNIGGKTNMENREIKFEDLRDRFDSLLSEYKDVCARLKEMESCGAPDEEQGELAGEKYILEIQLMKLGEKICDSTDSDEVKRDIARDFVDVEIEPGPCMAKFVGEVLRREVNEVDRKTNISSRYSFSLSTPADVAGDIRSSTWGIGFEKSTTTVALTGKKSSLEALVRERMHRIKKLCDEYRLEGLAKEIHALWSGLPDRECSIDYGEIEVRFRGKD